MSELTKLNPGQVLKVTCAECGHLVAFYLNDHVALSDKVQVEVVEWGQWQRELRQTGFAHWDWCRSAPLGSTLVTAEQASLL